MHREIHNSNKILPGLITASALALVTSQAAYAQSGTVSGSGTTTNSVLSYQDSTAIYSGPADLSGNTLTVDLTSEWNGGDATPPFGFTTESTLVIDVTDGSGTQNFSSCTGFALACGSFVTGVDNPYQATTISQVGDVISWTVQDTVLAETTPGDGNMLTIDDSFTATLSASGSGPAAAGDPNAVPTLSVPGLALTVAGLLAVGIRRLRKKL